MNVAVLLVPPSLLRWEDNLRRRCGYCPAALGSHRCCIHLLSGGWGGSMKEHDTPYLMATCWWLTVKLCVSKCKPLVGAGYWFTGRRKEERGGWAVRCSMFGIPEHWKDCRYSACTVRSFSSRTGRQGRPSKAGVTVCCVQWADVTRVCQSPHKRVDDLCTACAGWWIYCRISCWACFVIIFPPCPLLPRNFYLTPSGACGYTTLSFLSHLDGSVIDNN